MTKPNNLSAKPTGAVIPELLTLYIGLETPEDRDAVVARGRAIEILSARFPSFTITEGIGFFRGERESMLVAHIATDNPQEVADCAETVRLTLKQEGVGIAFRGRYFRTTHAGVPVLLNNHPEQ